MQASHDATERRFHKEGDRNLERHLQKLTKAAGIFHANNALQQDQISFLLKVNSESKIRCATRSIILGKAKVMSYDDLVAARATRSEKQAAKERGKKKGRRGKKAGIVGPDSKALDYAVKISNHGEGEARVDVLSDEVQIDEDAVRAIPFRAPVACMD